MHKPLSKTETGGRVIGDAIIGAVKKLDPRSMVKNPVMFVVEIVATLTTVLFLRDTALGHGGFAFALQINIWLWFTVLFANFDESLA